MNGVVGRWAHPQPTLPRRRGFDVLLDAGLSAADVAAMRRQFYESRGEEVPEDMGETSGSCHYISRATTY